MKATDIIPSPGRMLVEKEKETRNRTESGIYIPQGTNDGNETFRVLAVGEATKDQEPTAQVDDVVMIVEYGGSKFKLGDREYLFIGFNEVLATIKK